MCLDLIYWRSCATDLEYWRSNYMDSHFYWGQISSFLQNCATTSIPVLLSIHSFSDKLQGGSVWDETTKLSFRVQSGPLVLPLHIIFSVLNFCRCQLLYLFWKLYFIPSAHWEHCALLGLLNPDFCYATVGKLSPVRGKSNMELTLRAPLFLGIQYLNTYSYLYILSQFYMI